ncbi:MAG TPA: CrcB family protein [Thermoanaerobaculia bacterium]|jgi:CrcB protein|nr:CrcB family protein [Thermoanaerobaculia bacterium]
MGGNSVTLLLVCLGGALGSGARYLVALATPRGTLVVNLVGSFCIGLVLAVMRPSDLRLMLVTGVLGGFTTYSAFNEETLALFRADAFGAAVANVLVTLAGCLVAGAAGHALARLVR